MPCRRIQPQSPSLVSMSRIIEVHGAQETRAEEVFTEAVEEGAEAE